MKKITYLRPYKLEPRLTTLDGSYLTAFAKT